MLSHAIQPRQTSIGRPQESLPDMDGETDWKRAFAVLSSLLSRQFISSDCLVLLAYGLEDSDVELEAIKSYMFHVGLNRNKSMSDFMG